MRKCGLQNVPRTRTGCDIQELSMTLYLHDLSRPIRIVAKHAPTELKWLYRHFTWEFVTGLVYAVVGPNGAGKSTLLRDLAGISQPYQGRITIAGTDLHQLKAKARAREIAYLPQQTPLMFELTVYDLVMLGRAPYLSRFTSPSAHDKQAVDDALRRVDLYEFCERQVHTLSGGELQRAMMARMLATQASIFILDEPTTALDIGHVLSFFQLCRQLANKGVTIVMAMHELALAKCYADQVILLKGNKVGSVVAGSSQQVLTSTTLESVFNVTVKEIDSHLLFEPAPMQTKATHLEATQEMS